MATRATQACLSAQASGRHMEQLDYFAAVRLFPTARTTAAKGCGGSSRAPKRESTAAIAAAGSVFSHPCPPRTTAAPRSNCRTRRPDERRIATLAIAEPSSGRQ